MLRTSRCREFEIIWSAPPTSRLESRPAYTTVVNSDRKYVEVSESFCKLVSYEGDKLIGTRYDRLTAPETADVATTNSLTRFRYIDGFLCCCIAAVADSYSL